MSRPICTQNLFKTWLRLIAAAVALFASMVAFIGVSSACSKDTRVFPDLMDAVPIGATHFTYWNTDDLNTDEDLWAVYGRFKESADARQLEEFVPVLATVKQSAKIASHDNTSLGNPVTLFRGDFDAKYIGGQLEALNYSRWTHKEVSVWTPQDNHTYTKSVALHDRTLYVGDAADVTTYIDVSVQGNMLSLWEDPNARLVADKLPDGAIVEIHRADSSHGEQYPDLVAYGKSYVKANNVTFKVTAVYMFGDSPAAGAAVQQIEDYLASRFKDVKIKRDGNLVIATSQVSITDFVQTLEF